MVTHFWPFRLVLIPRLIRKIEQSCRHGHTRYRRHASPTRHGGHPTTATTAASPTRYRIHVLSEPMHSLPYCAFCHGHMGRGPFEASRRTLRRGSLRHAVACIQAQGDTINPLPQAGSQVLAAFLGWGRP